LWPLTALSYSRVRLTICLPIRLTFLTIKPIYLTPHIKPPLTYYSIRLPLKLSFYIAQVAQWSSVLEPSSCPRGSGFEPRPRHRFLREAGPEVIGGAPRKTNSWPAQPSDIGQSTGKAPAPGAMTNACRQWIRHQSAPTAMSRVLRDAPPLVRGDPRGRQRRIICIT